MNPGIEVESNQAGRGAPKRPAAIAIDHISKHYSNRALLGVLSGRDRSPDALHDVSFEVAEGEIVGLLGPNGAGKTTLLKIISGMLYPSSGTVLVEGRKVTDSMSGVHRRIGVVTSDERSFYWRLTGRQNLHFFAALYRLSAKQAHEQVESLLELLHLSDAGDRRFDTYSSGMKQRLAIARGLLNDPKIVLYDEPTRAVDPATARDIRQWIKNSNRRSQATCHLIATNQLGEAEQLCDRLVILNRGQIIASGSIPEIRSRYQEAAVHHVTCRGIGSWERLAPPVHTGALDFKLESLGPPLKLRLDAVTGSDALSWLFRRILEAGGAVESCRSEELPLDEVFCSLVFDRTAEDAAAGQEVAR
jgi:ABC-2 type transport system ATP-binding protein